MKISLEAIKKSEIPKANTALLLVHGGPGMDDSYFESSFDSIDPDLAIYSYSQGSFINAKNMNDLVVELNHVINTIPETNLFILGHSFGSALATEVVKFRQDNRISGLIWIAPALTSDWVKSFELFHADNSSLVDIEAQLAEKQKLLTVDELCKEDFLAYRDFYFPIATRSAGERLLSKVKYNGTLRAQIGSDYMTEFSLTEWLKVSSVPMCNIYGGKDMVIVKEYASRFNQFVFQGHAYEIQEGGHFPFIEDPETVVSSLRLFMNDVLKEKK